MTRYKRLTALQKILNAAMDSLVAELKDAEKSEDDEWKASQVAICLATMDAVNRATTGVLDILDNK